MPRSPRRRDTGVDRWKQGCGRLDQERIPAAARKVRTRYGTFDRLHAEGAQRAKVMAIAIHPYISGQPHRIKYLEAVYDYVNAKGNVLHWNGEQLLAWYAAQPRR